MLNMNTIYKGSIAYMEYSMKCNVQLFILFVQVVGMLCQDAGFAMPVNNDSTDIAVTTVEGTISTQPTTVVTPDPSPLPTEVIANTLSQRTGGTFEPTRMSIGTTQPTKNRSTIANTQRSSTRTFVTTTSTQLPMIWKTAANSHPPTTDNILSSKAMNAAVGSTTPHMSTEIGRMSMGPPPYHDYPRISMFNPSLSMMENYLQTDKEVADYLAGYEDDFQRTVVETQLKLCPYVPLCDFTVDVRTNQQSCCELCSCELSCKINRTCCPSILGEEFRKFALTADDTNKTIHDFPIFENNTDEQLPSCVSMHLTNRVSYRQTGFYAISTCPATTDQLLRLNCTSPYSNGSEFGDFLPVLSDTTLQTFRNQYCAYCNGISRHDVIFFKSSFSCSSKEPDCLYESASERGLIELVFATEKCDISFIYDDTRITLDQCDYFISICNATGSWKDYDSQVEAACLAYRSLFHHDLYIFQNVFCALCNGITPHTVTCDGSDLLNTGVFSFSGLLKLDFNQEFDATRSNGDDRTSCSSDQIFDILLDQCKDVSCPAMRSLQDGVCVDIFQTIASEFNYVFHIRLKPTSDVKVEEMFAMEMYLITEIYNILTRVVDSICDVIMMYKSDKKFTHDHTRQTHASMLLYADTRIILQTYGLAQAPWTVTDELINLHGTIMSIVDSYNTTVTFVIIVKDMNDRFFNTIGKVVNSDLYNLWMEKRGTTEHLALLGEYALSDIDGLTILPSTISFYAHQCHRELSCLKDIDVLRFSSCPKVNMSKQDISWTEVIDGIMVGELKINSDQYFHLDQDNIMLCVSAFQQIMTHLRPKRVFSAEVVVSVVSSTLSILALSITFIVFSLFQGMRKTLPGKNNMSLVVSLVTAQVMLLIGSLNPFQQYSIECQIIGMCIHFCWLCSIFWMNICTFHMFRVLSRIKSVSSGYGMKTFILYHAYVFLMSAIFVAVNITLSISASGQLGYGGQFCYITSQERILYTFVIPTMLVVLANMTMFIYVIVSIRRSPNVQKSVQNDRNELLIFAKLSTITGVTWVFGFLNIWTGIVAFSYMFIILNAGQGVFILLAFVLNRRVLSLFKDLFDTTSNETSTRSASGAKRSGTAITNT